MNENNPEQIIRCSYCLESNPITATVCKKCGKSLREVSQDNLTDNQPKDNDLVDFDGDISNTITGLLLLGIGTGIAWIPYIQYLGIILNFIGVILIFLNRHNFEAKHANYVVLSILIYIFFFIIAIATLIIGSTSLVGIINAPLSQQESMIRNYMQTMIIASIVAGVVGSFAYFTITYGLQDQKGKLLLRIALASYLVVETVIGDVLYSSVSSLLNNMFSGNSLNLSALISFSQTITLYSLLTIIPMVTFAIAYLRIRWLIDDYTGEVDLL